MARASKTSVPSPVIAYFSMEVGIDPAIPLPTAVALVSWRETPCAPTARDRILASRLEATAVKALLDNRGGYMVGEINREIAHTPLKDTWEKQNSLHTGLTDLLHILSG